MNLDWYNTLNKPLLTPQAEVFPAVWTILYILIFLSLIIFVTAKSLNTKTKGIILFIIQIFLNFFWSPIFFYWKNISLAFLVIILLDLFVILTIQEFYKVSKIASMFLIPYLLWILFATYLTFAFMILN